MGLIAAAMGAVGGTLADQWKEFFYCESMPKDFVFPKIKVDVRRDLAPHGSI